MPFRFRTCALIGRWHGYRASARAEAIRLGQAAFDTASGFEWKVAGEIESDATTSDVTPDPPKIASMLKGGTQFGVAGIDHCAQMDTLPYVPEHAPDHVLAGRALPPGWFVATSRFLRSFLRGAHSRIREGGKTYAG